jgi:hypothetical protein
MLSRSNDILSQAHLPVDEWNCRLSPAAWPYDAP